MPVATALLVASAASVVNVLVAVATGGGTPLSRAAYATCVALALGATAIGCATPAPMAPRRSRDCYGPAAHAPRRPHPLDREEGLRRSLLKRRVSIRCQLARPVHHDFLRSCWLQQP